MCFLVSFGIGVYSLVTIFRHDFTMNNDRYEQYQSNDLYSARHEKQDYNNDKKECITTEERPNDATLTIQREDAFAQALMSEQRDGWQTFVKTLIFILIDMTIFFIHWKIAKRTHVSKS